MIIILSNRFQKFPNICSIELNSHNITNKHHADWDWKAKLTKHQEI